MVVVCEWDDVASHEWGAMIPHECPLEVPHSWGTSASFFMEMKAVSPCLRVAATYF